MQHKSPQIAFCIHFAHLQHCCSAYIFHSFCCLAFLLQHFSFHSHLHSRNGYFDFCWFHFYAFQFKFSYKWQILKSFNISRLQCAFIIILKNELRRLWLSTALFVSKKTNLRIFWNVIIVLLKTKECKAKIIIAKKETIIPENIPQE